MRTLRKEHAMWLMFSYNDRENSFLASQYYGVDPNMVDGACAPVRSADLQAVI